MLFRDAHNRIIIHRLKNETNNTGIGSIHYSKSSGYFKVIDIDNKYDPDKHKNRYLVKFLDTGYQTNTSSGHVITGEVYDYRLPRVCGIGYLGDGYKSIKEYEDPNFLSKVYYRWVMMIKRCYDVNDKKYKLYGKKGISVSPRWHNFSNYYKDIFHLPGFNKSKVLNGSLSLDKDKLQNDKDPSEKVYSKDTCCWLTVKEQNEYVDFVSAHSHEMNLFIAITNNKISYCKGYKKFEREHGLPRGTISKIIDKNKIYKGFMFKSIT